MEIVNYDPEYYPVLYGFLKDKMDNEDIMFSQIETRVLLEDEPIGFYSAEKIGKFYNLHHFFIQEGKREIKSVLMLIQDLFKKAKSRGCLFLALHCLENSYEENFIRKFGRRRNVRLIEKANGFNFYTAEV